MRLEKISWVKAKAYFEQNDRVLLPVGSIESHGKHLPLGTDTLIPNRLAELIEARSDVMIAPALPYGCCDYLADFPGTISLGPEVFYGALAQITQHLFRHGARRFLILNGHGGNIPGIDRVGLDLRRQGGLLARLDWWLIAGQLNPLWKGGHGGAEETAGVMAVDCGLVDREMIADMELVSLCLELPATNMNTSGFEGLSIPIIRRSVEATGNGWAGPDHPKMATRQMGEDMLNATADYIVRFMEAFGKAAL